jgi:uncharacterized protein (DUF58 family)
MATGILDSHDYALIESLRLAFKRKIVGFAAGEQKSPVLGGGIEFADYREYVPGDDIRRVDWTVFLRFRKLLDTSRSMNFGEPDKLAVAKRISGVLSGIAVRGGNRAGVMSFERGSAAIGRAARNKLSFLGLLGNLRALGPSDSVDPLGSVRKFAAIYGNKCLAVFISDLLYPEWPLILSGLAASGCESHLIQILAPSELDPPELGETTLVDMENGTEIPLHVDSGTTRGYRRELDQFLSDAKENCGRLGIGYSMVSSDIPLARIFHDDLRRGGLVC